MSAYLVEKVVEKTYSGGNAAYAMSVEVEADFYVGFISDAVDVGSAAASAQEITDSVPVVGNKSYRVG